MNTTVYKSSPKLRRVLLIIGAALVALFATPMVVGIASGDTNTVQIAGVIGFIVLSIYVPIFWLAVWRYPRLILQPDGIEQHQLGMRLATTWSAVESFRPRGRPALILNTPMTGKGANRLAAFGGMHVAGAPMYSAEDRRLIAERRLFPLDAFRYWIDHGDLLEQLGEYVAVGDEDTGAATQRKWFADADGKPLPKKRLLLIAGVILASFGLSVAVITGPDAFAQRIDSLFAVVISVALGILGITNLVASWRFLRRRNLFGGVFWGIVGIVMLVLFVVSLR